jgi:curved DNA-binding protein CbpA
VQRDASPAEIRRAYRRKAAKLHPDKTGGDEAKTKVTFVDLLFVSLSDQCRRSFSS